MGNKKIEILAERRSARKNSDKTLRVLRHLDAARTKLDALQNIRRQMKGELRQAEEQTQQALARAEVLERKTLQQENELEALQILLEEQAGLIARFGLDTRRRRADKFDQEGPALTLLAIEKAAAKKALTNKQDESSVGLPTSFFSRLRWPWSSPANTKTSD